MNTNAAQEQNFFPTLFTFLPTFAFISPPYIFAPSKTLSFDDFYKIIKYTDQPPLPSGVLSPEVSVEVIQN